MASQLAGLRAQRTVPRGLIRHGAAIPIPSAIAADLPADGRGRAAELGCDRPQRTARDKPPGYLLAFDQPERATRSPPLSRTDASRGRQDRENRRGLPIKPAADRAHRLPTLPSIPDLGPLRCRVIYPLSPIHPFHSHLVKDCSVATTT